MERAVNIFTDGVTSDMHPLTTAENVLTDALNATTITFNGDEMILQNDMGNTLILDTTTGNVMGLSDGFIPVGMKEYSGILYIASYNPKTNEGELGTVPSPKIDYIFQNGKTLTNETELTLDVLGGTEYSETELEKTLYGAVKTELTTKIADGTYKAGDQFIIVLDLDGIDGVVTRTAHTTDQSNAYYNNRIIFPVISLFETTQENQKIPGWFEIKLFSVIPGKAPVELTNVTCAPQEFYLVGVDEKQVSPYWFIPYSMLKGKEIDVDRCQTEAAKGNVIYRLYPNVLSGKLAIKIIPNVPDNLLFMTNNSTGLNTPFTFTQVTKS